MEEKTRKLWIIACLLYFAFILFYPPVDICRPSITGSGVFRIPSGRKVLFETFKKNHGGDIFRPNIYGMIIEILFGLCIAAAIYLLISLISKKKH